MIGEDQLLSVLAFVLALEAFEYFAVHKESSDVFAMKFGWRIFYFVLLGVLLGNIHGVRIAPLTPHRYGCYWPWPSYWCSPALTLS